MYDEDAAADDDDFDTDHVSQNSYDCEMQQQLTYTDTGKTKLLESDDEESRSVSTRMTSRNVSKWPCKPNEMFHCQY